MHRFLACCGGFLLAVLWMDLMFDAQVWSHPPGPLPDEVLSSIAAYYRRVTTEADPMRSLVGAVMVATLAGTFHQLIRGQFSLWLRIAAALSSGVAIGLALLRVFPSAVELGGRAGSLEVQSALARSIFHQHVFSLVCMIVFIGIQLSVAPGANRSGAQAAG
jgi:hypothetical protein